MTSAEHEALNARVGFWRGATRTWFDPDSVPEESITEAEIEAIFEGRFLRISYRGTAMGKPHEGWMILGFHRDAGEYEMTWIDTFHTGSAMMFAHGRDLSLLGSYLAGGERWGWRTVLSGGGDELAIDAFNISPDGREDRAIETRLTRVVR